MCNYVGTRIEFWKEKVSRFLSEDFRNYVLTNCNAGDTGDSLPN